MSKLEEILKSRRGKFSSIFLIITNELRVFPLIFIIVYYLCYIFYIDELSGDVFETLYNLGDFLDFKDLMLSYKNSKEATAPVPTASAAPVSASSGSSKSKSSNKNQGGGMLDLCITGKHI